MSKLPITQLLSSGLSQLYHTHLVRSMPWKLVRMLVPFTSSATSLILR